MTKNVQLPLEPRLAMPADTSKNLSLNATRRSSRKFSSEEEIELKRARGELSCAECRR